MVTQLKFFAHIVSDGGHTLLSTILTIEFTVLVLETQKDLNLTEITEKFKQFQQKKTSAKQKKQFSNRNFIFDAKSPREIIERWNYLVSKEKQTKNKAKQNKRKPKE